jgi:Reverse transcriptase (RNA-dependent DNA polymerase)
MGKQKIRASILNSVLLHALNWSKTINDLDSNDLQRFLGEVVCHYNYEDGTFDWQHPMEFSARANADDNPTWEEAMHGPDKAGYWKAMEKEKGTLEEMESWEVIDIKPWMNVLPGTWAFRCKRFPDGTIRKLKARFCVQGDRQREGIDFFDTYAPVVNWLTVRFMLVLSEILGLATKQVDYTAAFVHAAIDRDPNWENMTEEERSKSGIYVQMPRGFGQAGNVLKLKKSLYGLKQAPRNFFLHLKAQLEAIGFKSQEDLDPCLFMSKNVICLVYVDDTSFYSPKMEYIDEAIRQLRE